LKFQSMFRNQTEIPYSFEKSDLIVGTVYSSVSTACCILQLIVLHILFFDNELKNVSSYSVMFHLSLADLLQLVFHIISGIFVIFQTTFHPWLEKICGALINTGCIVYTPLTMLLAMNRFVVICCPRSMQFIFSSSSTKRWTNAIWLYGCCFFTAYISPMVTIFFDPSVFMWGHVGPQAKLVHDAEYYAALVELCVTGVLYAAVVVRLALQARFVSKQAAVIQRYEARVLVQAMIISFFIGFVLFTWYNFDSFVASTKWTFFVINMMWILNCGINPVLYVILNKTIRRKMMRHKCMLLFSGCLTRRFTFLTNDASTAYGNSALPINSDTTNLQILPLSPPTINTVLFK
ncbi:hypothetical protein Tcan_00603, partial [Toxocara canis]